MLELLNKYSLDVENPEYNFQLALMYDELGQTASAISFYLRAAELSNDLELSYTALLRMGLCFEKQGRRNLTVKGKYLQAITVLPKRPEAYYLLARIQRREELFHEAYTTIEIALSISDFSLEKLICDVQYPGYHGFIFEKAICSWWWGKSTESKNLFTDIYTNYWEVLSEDDKLFVKKRMIDLGLSLVAKEFSKKVFFDCGTHMFQGFKEVSKIHGIDDTWNCYCFEANPITYEMSKENYLSLINDKFNIVHFNNAISNNNKSVIINCAQSDHWDGSEIGSSTSQASNILDTPPKDCSGKVLNYSDRRSVKSVNFSDFIKMFSDENDFVVVKLDIEGSEFDVIDKLIEENTIDYVNHFYIEFHSHFFENTELYNEKIEYYKKIFENRGINFTQWT